MPITPPVCRAVFSTPAPTPTLIEGTVHKQLETIRGKVAPPRPNSKPAPSIAPQEGSMAARIPPPIAAANSPTMQIFALPKRADSQPDRLARMPVTKVIGSMAAPTCTADQPRACSAIGIAKRLP
ncbi:hypothetical protein D9M68_747150 [compost metagenome]